MPVDETAASLSEIAYNSHTYYRGLLGVRRVATAVEDVIADIQSDSVEFGNIKELFWQLELLHWSAYYTAKKYEENDVVIGKKTTTSNEIEDECWRRIVASLQGASEQAKTSFIEWVKTHQSNQYEKGQAHSGSVHSMIGGLPELGKNR